MEVLAHHKGKSVSILCGEPSQSVSPPFVRSAVVRTTHATLRGLEARKLIGDCSYFWRGARVTVQA